MTKWRGNFRLGLGLLVLLQVGVSAQADVLYSTGPGGAGGFTVEGGNAGFAQAMQFSPVITANLTDALFDASGPVIGFDQNGNIGPGSVTGLIAADSGGKPGAILATVGSVLVDSNNTATYALNYGGPQLPLALGTQYWFILEPTDPNNSHVEIQWALSSHTGNFSTQKPPGGGAWGATLTGAQAAFAIEGSPTGAPAVPEPATLTLLGLGVAGLVGYGWRRRKLVAA